MNDTVILLRSGIHILLKIQIRSKMTWSGFRFGKSLSDFLKLLIGTKKMGYFWMKDFFMKSRELTIIWTVPMFHLFQSPIHHLSALTVTYKDFQNGQKLMPIPSSCSNFRTCPNWHIYSCAEFDKSESV